MGEDIKRWISASSRTRSRRYATAASATRVGAMRYADATALEAAQVLKTQALIQPWHKRDHVQY